MPAKIHVRFFRYLVTVEVLVAITVLGDVFRRSPPLLRWGEVLPFELPAMEAVVDAPLAPIWWCCQWEGIHECPHLTQACYILSG